MANPLNPFAAQMREPARGFMSFKKFAAEKLDASNFRLFQHMYAHFEKTKFEGNNEKIFKEQNLQWYMAKVDFDLNRNDLSKLYNADKLAGLADNVMKNTTDALFPADSAVTGETMSNIKLSIAQRVLVTTFVMGLYDYLTMLHTEIAVTLINERSSTELNKLQTNFESEKGHLKDLLNWMTAALGEMYTDTRSKTGDHLNQAADVLAQRSVV